MSTRDACSVIIRYSTVVSGEDMDGVPCKQALYDPQFERDACGVGFVVNIDGIRSQKVVNCGIPRCTELCTVVGL